MKLGGSVLLEPIMKVEVTAPEDDRAFVRRDLQSRLGILQGEEMRGDLVMISATVPLANMIGYVDELASVTHDRATASSVFARYQVVDVTPDGPPPAAAAALRT